MLVVLNTVVPVFSIIALGAWLGGTQRLDLGTLSDLTIMITSPALIFSVLVRTELDPSQGLVLVFGTLWIVLGTGVLAYLYVRRDPGTLRGLALPALFWNSGNMALPCARLAFGQPGLEAAIIVFVAMATLQSSISIWIAKGRGGWSEVLRMPLFHASVLGLAVKGGGVALPQMVLEPIRMVGDMAIPLMLINLGVQLRRLQVTDVAHAIVAVAIRMGGGLLLGLAFVAVFAVVGVNRQVLLLDAIMPPAVINIVIAQRYETAPSLVASAILLGTLLSLGAIPILLVVLT